MERQWCSYTHNCPQIVDKPSLRPGGRALSLEEWRNLGHLFEAM